MLTPEVYNAIPRRALDFGDYIDVVRRHRGWILGPVFAGVVVGAVVALVLPNTYVSQASLRITPAQISENILPSIVSQQMSDRITQMEQDILSRTSLSELIQRRELDLYHKERERKPLDDVIEIMRTRDVHIQVARLGGGDRPASAFTITFAYPDRYKAQAVVGALVTRFMESNYTGQKEAGVITQNFVHDEVGQAKTELDRLNTELTDFRKEHGGTLPEQIQMNVQAMSSLQSERAALDDSLNRDSQEKIMLESKLDTLRSQKSAYSSLAQQNFDDPAQSGKSDRVHDLNKTINDTEIQLAAKKEIYTESHPDVQSLEATLAALKKQRDAAEREDEKQPAGPTGTKSASARRQSQYMAAQLNDMDGLADQTRSQLKALEMDRTNRMKQLDQVNAQISRYQSRMESAPVNEQRYSQLMSDQQQANLKYQDLLRKQSLTEENQNAQTRKAGENLEVLDPASLPESPTAPNRWAIIGAGFAIGAVLGLALAGLREIKDTSLKNLKDVRAYTQLPILGSIPLLENDLLVQRRRRMAYVSWSAALVLGMLAISISMYYHYFLLKS